MISALVVLSTAFLANARDEQPENPKTNVIFNMFRQMSLYNRGNVGSCGDFDEMSHKYFSGDTFTCTDGKATWTCQVYTEGYTCSSSIQKFDQYFQTSAFLVGSTIVSSNDEKKFLFESLPAKKTASTLLYRGSRDGWLAFDFHSRVDNKGQTVTLFRTDKGYRIGGYT
jgi:hypothetical protein